LSATTHGAEPVKVYLVNPPIQDPWRTQGDYQEEQRRGRRLYWASFLSIIISALVAVATSLSAIAAIRQYSAPPAPQAVAWVLWQRQDSPGGSRLYQSAWLVDGASLTEKECSRSAAATAPREVAKEGGGKMYVSRICLPDTVDPRAPKGK